MRRMICLTMVILMLALVSCPAYASSMNVQVLSPLLLSAADQTAASWMTSTETRALFCATALIDVILSDNTGLQLGDINFNWGAYIGRSGLSLFAIIPLKNGDLLLVQYIPFNEEGQFGNVGVEITSKSKFDSISKQTMQGSTSTYYSVSSEDFLDSILTIASIAGITET